MLSPKLFSEFLTDLKKYLEKKCGLLIDDDILTYILYTDDLILCLETAEGLQKLIDSLFEFCKNPPPPLHFHRVWKELWTEQT